MHDQGRWVLPEILARQARRQPGQRFVTMIGGGSLSYGEAGAEADRMAGFLAGLGVRPGEHVAVMLPSGLDFVRVWLGLGRLGAVLVALNTELKGAFLAHQLGDSGARLAIVAPALAPVVEAVRDRLPALATVLVAGEGLAGWREAPSYDGPMPRPGDTACVIYTSGTTGPAKGVLMPHAHCYLFGLGTIDNLGVGPDDLFYVVLPLFHANGLFMQLGAALIVGAGAVLRERFSASSWLADLRAYGCTVTNMLGAVAAFVCAQPARSDDRDHRLRVVGMAPDTPEHDRILRERFGVAEVIAMYGMTEVNIPLYGVRGQPRPGSCGRPWERWFEVEIRDPDTDLPLPRGAVGEIMVRPKAAFGFMSGYHRMPAKTVEAWRNLWFHTGDAAVMDEDGTVFFRDRIKDCIRRRGENISSFEIEAAIAGLPGIAEVAAFAVPSDIEGAEDEVMLAIVAAPGAAPDPEAIAAHAARELPRYAQPRFVAFVDALPRTPTAKVRKAALRAGGVPPGTWDRLATP